MSVLSNRAYGYSKMENEDPEEVQHRLAQFLIYKAMQKADTKRRPSWLRVKMFKLKIKIGKRLKKLRKGFSTTLFSAKADFCKQISDVLKSCKYLVQGKQGPIIRTLPPMF
ncbi:hypothetical protein BUALT_Bualt03G0075700 [Buddleja alternifolia]|uniref:Uncharacterized protein n=1 Tax=Buddleja alternifolia TaxID=168488 RepID=A0AAV6XRT1_9LAMI|nr:hypothetical protein BUALT_Bualt03G0075700 [Buddleja alternifolia]